MNSWWYVIRILLLIRFVNFQEYTPVNGEHNTSRYQHQNNRHSVDMTSPQSQHGECYYERGDR